MVYATIMAGGAGTRFWPASRKSNPKQLLKLTGDRSMLQSTVDRLAGFCSNDHIMIVTNQSLVDPIAVQMPGIPRECIIGEPAKRDTGPCISLAATLLASRDPEATMVVMPADHVIYPTDLFQKSLRGAVELVEEDPQRIVTFGIQPTYPAEVFGYIQRDDASLDCAGFSAYRVDCFREKPDAATAQEFLDSGTFYWNSGIFVWKAKTILEAIRRFEPAMFHRVTKISESIGLPEFNEILQREFTAMDCKSIDFAVMEHYENVLVVEAPFEWDDLGNWSALPRLRGRDEHGNTSSGRAMMLDTQNCIIQAGGSESEHLIVTVGIKNCIIVHTADATLIAKRNDEAAVKQVVQQLEERQWEQYL